MTPAAVRTFALILGIVFVVVGIAGFIPAFVVAPATDAGLALDHGHGRLFGLFPVNWLHNLVHLAFGVWGLVASRGFGGARGYARAVAVIYAVLAVMGLIPVLRTTFGLIPLYGHDIWLHFAIAAVAAVFGFMRVSNGTTARP
ncbi:DUF4383 domain-containing protein [Caenispirillum bisanense]|uniref:DUF4383 domain-containing protein n=1 Tax=Caenispirillum bisanense TaxID=414052 RepID=UPI0031DCAAD3